MPIPAEQALVAFEAFVSENRRYCRLAELWEDDHDYFATTELVPPYSEWPLGPGFLFVAKTTGKLWEASPGEVLDKIDAMAPVAPKRSPTDLDQFVSDE